MIVDSMDRIALYEGILPHAREIAALWAARSPEGASVEVRQKGYETKADDARLFEVHDHTIDLMVGLSGAEIINVCPACELEPGKPLPNGADGRKLIGGPRGSAVMLREGYFVALYPGEAHMVGGQCVPGEAAPLEKWVVKLPL